MSLKYKILVVDENQDDLEYLLANLQTFKQLKIIHKTTSIEEAIDISLLKKPDIIFCEIELGSRKAFEIIDSLRSINFYPAIIFVSRTDTYALRSIKYRPYAYLLRPFDEKILRAAVYRIIGNVNPAEDEQFIINTRENDVFIKIKDILYCKAENSTTSIYVSKNNIYSVSFPIGVLAERFQSYNFFKCHRSYLINLDYLRKIERRNDHSFGILQKERELFEVKFSPLGIKNLKIKVG